MAVGGLAVLECVEHAPKISDIVIFAFQQCLPWAIYENPQPTYKRISRPYARPRRRAEIRLIVDVIGCLSHMTHHSLVLTLLRLAREGKHKAVRLTHRALGLQPNNIEHLASDKTRTIYRLHSRSETGCCQGTMETGQ